MKISNDYLSLIKRQYDYIFSDLKSEDVSDKSKILFDDICKKLEKDFLPPIEREDIAAISCLLYEMGLEDKRKILNEKLKYQIKLAAEATKELFEKKKSCGETIRRIISVNAEFRASNESELKFNSLISVLLRKLNEAYYKNL